MEDFYKESTAMIAMAYAFDLIDKSKADKLAEELSDIAKAESALLDMKIGFAENLNKRISFTK